MTTNATSTLASTSEERCPNRHEKCQPEVDSTNNHSFLNLPSELRVQIYKMLAKDSVFHKNAMCTPEKRPRLQIPPILCTNKLIREESSMEFKRHAPFILTLPISVWQSFLMNHSECRTLKIALPQFYSPCDQKNITSMPARRLCLQVNWEVVNQTWNEVWPSYYLPSVTWFMPLLSRLQGCQNLTELSIRWCLPSVDQAVADEALHAIFGDLVDTAESMPGLERYSIQIGSNLSVVSDTPQWGVSILSAYGRRSKGKAWEGEGTVRHCCQGMPYGEWYDFLYDLNLYSMSEAVGHEDSWVERYDR